MPAILPYRSLPAKPENIPEAPEPKAIPMATEPPTGGNKLPYGGTGVQWPGANPETPAPPVTPAATQQSVAAVAQDAKQSVDDFLMSIAEGPKPYEEKYPQADVALTASEAYDRQRARQFANMKIQTDGVPVPEYGDPEVAPRQSIDYQVKLGQRMIQDAHDQAMYHARQNIQDVEQYYQMADQIKQQTQQKEFQLRQQADQKIGAMLQIDGLVKGGIIDPQAGRIAKFQLAGLPTNQVAQPSMNDIFNATTTEIGKIDSQLNKFNAGQSMSSLYNPLSWGKTATVTKDEQTGEIREITPQEEQVRQTLIKRRIQLMEQLNDVVSKQGNMTPQEAMARKKAGGLQRAASAQMGGIVPKVMTPDLAYKFVQAAGGNKQKARQIAKAQGYQF